MNANKNLRGFSHTEATNVASYRQATGRNLNMEVPIGIVTKKVNLDYMDYKV